ncbi:energy-coupling factor ABC transporter ATP-binding protein [Aeromonas sp. RU39B]|uniref:energy-coupling factor ABC transporter ATP-binding protein n=1 Tax=Aeromonas sp. RU39B TaxID=1907416 RepID=UPI000970FABB|nr:ATP-binding cassette domain-containing protein [Aeromonas sp. RU39B]
MLITEHLSWLWPGNLAPCINDLSLNIADGEWVALVGDNGAGKSTLLRLLAGLLTPRQGVVKLDGMSLTSLTARQRASRIGVLFQEVEKQLFHSSVFDEVAFGLHAQQLPVRDVLSRTHEALAFCGLTDVAKCHPLDLNAGQRRMIAVAALMAMSPDVLLLDEPSRDFDSHWLVVFERWLAYCKGQPCTVLCISHDYHFILKHFHRCIRLDQGEIVQDQVPKHVLGHSPHHQ